MRDDLKALPMPPRPLFTAAEKKRILLDGVGILFVVVMIIVAFSLFAMMIKSPVPTVCQEEVMSK